MTAAATLPTILRPENSDLAVALLKDYFAPPEGQGSDFSGAHFETVGRNWNDTRYANRITASDLVAVTTLSVDVHPDTAIALLGHCTDPVTALLEQIPTDLDLWDASDAHIGPNSPARQLWTQLRHLKGITQPVASKLLARKRARLIPIFEPIVGAELGLRDAGPQWAVMRDLMQSGGSTPLHLQLEALGQRAGLNMDRVTPLRIFDVAVWYFANPKLTKRVGWVAADHGATVPST